MRPNDGEWCYLAVAGESRLKCGIYRTTTGGGHFEDAEDPIYTYLLSMVRWRRFGENDWHNGMEVTV